MQYIPLYLNKTNPLIKLSLVLRITSLLDVLHLFVLLLLAGLELEGLPALGLNHTHSLNLSSFVREGGWER